jgi:tetratricopeptide (TPR) repeat protein
MNNLAQTYLGARQYADAVPLLVAWLDRQKERRTVDDFDVAGNLNALGECQVGLKKFEAAEKSLRQSLALFVKEHSKAFMRHDTENLLGAALAGQGRFSEAEPLLVDSARIIAKHASRLSPKNYRRGCADLDRVIAFYEARGNTDEAARWREVRDEAFPKKK